MLDNVSSNSLYAFVFPYLTISFFNVSRCVGLGQVEQTYIGLKSEFVYKTNPIIALIANTIIFDNFMSSNF